MRTPPYPPWSRFLSAPPTDRMKMNSAKAQVKKFANHTKVRFANWKQRHAAVFSFKKWFLAPKNSWKPQILCGVRRFCTFGKCDFPKKMWKTERVNFPEKSNNSPYHGRWKRLFLFLAMGFIGFVIFLKVGILCFFTGFKFFFIFLRFFWV